jgi:hypothetical protein
MKQSSFALARAKTLKEISFVNLRSEVLSKETIDTVREQFKLALPTGQKIVVTGGNFNLYVNTIDMKGGKKLFVVNLVSDDNAVQEGTIKSIKSQLKGLLPKGYKSVVITGADVQLNTLTI